MLSLLTEALKNLGANEANELKSKIMNGQEATTNL
jgi:hypothetical protein